jgi:hypothetical protein
MTVATAGVVVGDACCIGVLEVELPPPPHAEIINDMTVIDAKLRFIKTPFY